MGSFTSPGIDARLHIYPLCGVFHFPWHRHQVTFTPCVGSFTSPGIDTRLHIYPLCGVFHFPWHRRQVTHLPPVWGLSLPLAYTPGYTFTPCVGSFTSPGIHARLHIYPLCGVFHFPWHRHQVTHLPPVWGLSLPLA